ncbi:zinc finger protein 510 [Copidosoma floridanum]|uniref:zinc finger protein 510 n=1 Tax=Copidosoma floridanum TaxID=29053 RepID=UPI0006C96C2E|nr:zinc finger protein 510 [Copidosoma floridanum]
MAVRPDDGLSHYVCLLCIGGLEFISDFQKQCHDTQKSLHSSLNASNIEVPNKKPESDGESDKENASPSKKSTSDNLPNSNNICDKPCDEITINASPQISNSMMLDTFDTEQTANILMQIKNSRSLETKRVGRNTPKYVTESTKINVKNNKKMKSINNSPKITSSKTKNIKENVDPNDVGCNNQGDVIFEGTVVDSSEGTSIIMPIKIDSINANLQLDDAVMADVADTDSLYTPTILNGSNDQSFFSKEHLSGKIDEIDGAKVSESYLQFSPSSPFNSSKHEKMSKLLTKEQKEEIEKSYVMDHSLIDEEKISSYMTEQMNNKSKKSYVCTYQNCNRIFDRRDKCGVHIQGHLDMKPYLCKQCNFKTVTVSNVKIHINKVHLKVKPYSCYLCPKTYNTHSALVDHINGHQGLKPYECDSCSFKCGSKQSVRSHILNHHQKLAKDFPCDICGKLFYRKNQMQTHRVIHDKSRRFKCNLCSSYLLSRESLQLHMQRSHQKNYACDNCEKSFVSKKALNNHKITHFPPRYKCIYCGNFYKSKHTLRDHTWYHHESIYKYICSKCGKKCKSKANLSTHMAVHSSIRFGCPSCGKAPSNRYDNLKEHMKKCIKDRPDLQHYLTRRPISYSKNRTARVKAKN